MIWIRPSWLTMSSALATRRAGKTSKTLEQRAMEEKYQESLGAVNVGVIIMSEPFFLAEQIVANAPKTLSRVDTTPPMRIFSAANGVRRQFATPAAAN
jgi:hypothetical protein